MYQCIIGLPTTKQLSRFKAVQHRDANLCDVISNPTWNLGLLLRMGTHLGNSRKQFVIMITTHLENMQPTVTHYTEVLSRSHRQATVFEWAEFHCQGAEKRLASDHSTCQLELIASDVGIIEPDSIPRLVTLLSSLLQGLKQYAEVHGASSYNDCTVLAPKPKGVTLQHYNSRLGPGATIPCTWEIKV